ncbi:T9SS type A sorting domain-containing protein [Yeosuana sp.]|uniref:T9SS type A sorting domain-containing protein n=1 Tax=Yeosuana sp. TaxID=2529388 RepID=UPI004054FBA1
MIKKITFIKTLTFLLTFFGTVTFGFGQTTLAEGDVVITGVNADDPDQFSFVLLTDVINGTTINFTDFGWLSTGGFYTLVNEGVVSWTAGSDLLCGTEIIIENIGSPNFSATSGTAVQTDPGFTLAGTNGDQISAYQGTLTTPTFLYAIHFGNNNGWTDATDTNNSAVPAGLTDGVNAMDIGNYDNGVYNCSITSNQSLIQSSVVNPTNWSKHNTNRQTLGGCTFTCSAAGSCASTVTWDGTNWLPTNPDLTTAAIISANYVTGNSVNEVSFRACNLTVDAGFTLNVSNDTYVEVENSVVVNGSIIVETRGNFVQNDSRGTFTDNAGTTYVYKETPLKLKWYYYTYWSTPVKNETVDGAFPFTDPDRRFMYNAANYNDRGDGIDLEGDDWQIAAGGEQLIPGVGYAATSGQLGIYPGNDSADFYGEFNTGDIPTSIFNNSANTDSWNFIGNPYPCAIDFIAFQSANSTIVDGAAYFWSQASPPLNTNPGNQVLNFNQNDYAIYTVGSGGVAGGSPDIPTQYVPSAQGFFVAGLSTADATFTNAMRMADGTSNDLFFKTTITKKSSSVANKLWVNLTSDNGVFGQILVAYVDGATNGNDGLSYDATKLLSDNPSILFSTIENSNKKFAIQGKAINSINADEVIYLGFNTSIDVPTLYTLSIAQLQGDFLTANTIYLKDNLTNTLHDLSASDYTFTSEVGEFNTRFQIVFNAVSLSTDTFDFNANTVSILQVDDTHVSFRASNNQSIKTVTIYDLLGRQLYQLKGQNSEETYNLSKLNHAIFIAKIELSNGAFITKKAIKK